MEVSKQELEKFAHAELKFREMFDVSRRLHGNATAHEIVDNLIAQVTDEELRTELAFTHKHLREITTEILEQERRKNAQRLLTE